MEELFLVQTPVNIHQHIGGTGDGIIRTPPRGDALDQGSLSGTKVTLQTDDISGLEQLT
jgi:hypothetical protein